MPKLTNTSGKFNSRYNCVARWRIKCRNLYYSHSYQNIIIRHERRGLVDLREEFHFKRCPASQGFYSLHYKRDITHAYRLDGRKLDEFRNLKIHFGNDWGLCYTSLGETRVITQVSCEVKQPKTTRPNEGLLFINVEVSSMAAAHIEPGRASDVNVHLNRLLEKCIKDSKAIDLESLCLIAEEKVLALKVDVNILNHDGNLIQAASISSLAALAHFKRPDVTTNGEEITIHDITERDPIPLTLHHYPVCISFALMNSGESVLADPTSIEERISDATLVFGINSFGELCGLYLGGSALVDPTLIFKYCQKASVKAKETVETIKKALSLDAGARQLKQDFGLVESIHWDKIKSLSDSRLKVKLTKFKLSTLENNEDGDEAMDLVEDDLKSEVIDLGENCAELVSSRGKKLKHLKKLINDETPALSENQRKIIQVTDVWGVEKIGEGGPSKWKANTCSENQPMEDSDSCEPKDDVAAVSAKSRTIEDAEISGDSEEEVVILNPQDISNFAEASKPTDAKTENQGRNQGNDTSKMKNQESKNSRKKNKKKLWKKQNDTVSN